MALRDAIDLGVKYLDGSDPEWIRDSARCSEEPDACVDLISVIIPFYNAAHNLPRLFRNLDALQYPNVEVILVDDGSSDSGGDLALGYAESRERVKVLLSSVNRGPGPARNLGLSAATGEFVWFADADDDWRPEILSVFHDSLRRTGADIAVCRARWVDGAGAARHLVEGFPAPMEVSGTDAFDLVLRGRLKGFLWSKFFRMDLFGADPFPSLRSHEDFCAIVPIIARARAVLLIPDVLYSYRFSSCSVMNSSTVDFRPYAVAESTVLHVSSILGRTSLASRWRVIRFRLEGMRVRSRHASRVLDADRAVAEVRAVRGRVRPSELLAAAVLDPFLAIEISAIGLTPRMYRLTFALARSLREGTFRVLARTQDTGRSATPG